jgi:hypothetical protein
VFFFKFVISDWVGHCHHSPLVSKNLAMPLIILSHYPGSISHIVLTMPNSYCPHSATIIVPHYITMILGSGQVPAFVMTVIEATELLECQLFLHGISHIVNYTMRKTTVLLPLFPHLIVSFVKHYLDQKRN